MTRSAHRLLFIALISVGVFGCQEMAEPAADAGPAPDHDVEIDSAAPDATADAAPDFAADADARADAAPAETLDRGLLPDQRSGPPPIVDAGLSGDLGSCDAEPVTVLSGRPTRFESCGPGHLDRIDGNCGPNIEGEHFEACLRDDDFGCRVDADCPGGTRCIETGWHCACVTLCETDDDCGPDSYCVCPRRRREPSTCYQADCGSADDCGGSPCGAALDVCHILRGLQCRTPADTCRTHDDCVGEGDGGSWECAWLVGEGRFGCRFNDAICE